MPASLGRNLRQAHKHRSTNIERRLADGTFLTHGEAAWMYAIIDPSTVLWASAHQRNACEERTLKLLFSVSVADRPAGHDREMHLLGLARDDPTQLPGEAPVGVPEPHPRPAVLAVGVNLQHSKGRASHNDRCDGRRRRRCRCFAGDAANIKVALVVAGGRLPSPEEADRLLGWHCRGGDPDTVVVVRDDSRAVGCSPWVWDPLRGETPHELRHFYWHSPDAAGLQFSAWPLATRAGHAEITAMFADRPDMVAVSVRGDLLPASAGEPPRLRNVSGVAARRIHGDTDTAPTRAASPEPEVVMCRQIDALCETRPGDRSIRRSAATAH